ncbi:transcriptional regulator, LysR family (plasmid) [Deinococcus geothermalis DSM 11300]|uniref:Transcriptional regulator, LysR family n=1 Tax=Deinococcus geothermalis (strain DSM 11300 / CIP 105573 / AG-3a) TaxID=319795 RepID=Q1J2L5_DEIGD|nr:MULTISPECIES: LysR family transcriptional regulator [Deinococcus]ABF44269.1 transcriptional regulator, LysR family [Deinococcus geothermalis DSM 11300]MBI0446374.1 LysR family transcriptional regulator [Deinococcus sp. DB0503]
MLNPEHLLTFARVARLGSLSAAAEELYLTQPAVSHQLKLLTHAVGEPLFRRHRTGVHLTAAGEGLLPHAQALARALEGAQHYVQELRGLERGVLSVAASSTIAAALLPRVLTAFHSQYPEVTFQVRQGNTREVLDALQSGQVELALIEGPPGPLGPHLQARAFGEDELILVIAPTHPLAQAGLQGVATLPLVWREHGSGTREVAEQALAGAGLQTRTVLELPGTEAVKEAVMGGLGAAFLPERRVHREVQAGLLTRLELTLPGLRRPLIQVTPPPEQLSQAARTFLNLLHRQTRDQPGG